MSTLDGSYHHGDLRRALIEAGLAILAQGASPATLSLRAAARRAGVSAMAPYRHFPDKDALLAAIAAVGFERLAAAQREADQHEDDVENLVGQGIAYVAFACADPALFRLMFGTTAVAKTGALATAAATSYGVLAARVSSLVAADEVPTMTLLCWSTAHGLADFAIAGHLVHLGDAPLVWAERVLRACCVPMRA